MDDGVGPELFGNIFIRKLLLLQVPQDCLLGVLIGLNYFATKVEFCFATKMSEDHAERKGKKNYKHHV